MQFSICANVFTALKRKWYKKMGGRFGELLLIFLIILVLFGAGRIPKVMRDIGSGINALKEGLKRPKDDNDDKDNENK